MLRLFTFALFGCCVGQLLSAAEGPAVKDRFKRGFQWPSGPVGLPGPPGPRDMPHWVGPGGGSGMPGLAVCPPCRHKCFAFDKDCNCVFDIACGFREGIPPQPPSLPALPSLPAQPPRHSWPPLPTRQPFPLLPTRQPLPLTTYLRMPPTQPPFRTTTLIGFPSLNCPGECEFRNNAGICEENLVCLFGTTTQQSTTYEQITTQPLPSATLIGFPSRDCPGKCEFRISVGLCEQDLICLFGTTAIPRTTTSQTPRPTLIGFPSFDCPDKCEIRNSAGICEQDLTCLIAVTPLPSSSLPELDFAEENEPSASIRLATTENARSASSSVPHRTLFLAFLAPIFIVIL